MSAKKGLGKGLESLFVENSSENGSAIEVRLSEIEPNREQPRKYFNDESIEELSESIKKHGLIQPIVVRPLVTGGYRIIAGERRWRASRKAGLTTVPVIVKEIDDLGAAELALIENLQREDLNPIEEAEGYRSLMDNFGLTQEQVSEKVGKSRPAIANALRLLSLNDEEMKALTDGKITQGHARTLLSIKGETARKEALALAKQGCSVRELETFSKKAAKGERAPKKSEPKPKFLTEVEIALTREVGRKITVTGNGRGGTIHIEFFDDDDLKEMAERIAGINF